jgi:CHAT domain-containing protein/Tfp pilus assembly protein PilF
VIISFRIWLGLLLLTVLLADAVPDPGKGVIVANVTKNFEGEKVGFQPGDIILSWMRDGAKGGIESPFDFLQIEVEQKPRGPVVIEGLRGTEKHRWTLGPDVWGVQTRPELPDNLLSFYRECQALGKTGEAASSPEHCRADAGANGSPWFAAWFALQAAEALANALQWQQSDKAYEQAVQFAHQAGPAIAAQLLNEWAAAYEVRGDLQNAEKRYQESLLECQKSESESFCVATGLNGLGSVARKRGDLAKAEEHSRHALAIEEKLAPGSLDVATSLNNLGNVAWARRDLTRAVEYHSRALDLRQRLVPAGLAVAASLNNLGMLAWQTDQADKAEEYQLKALEIRERLAPGSMDLAASFNNLATIAWDRGDLVRSERYYRRGLEIREKLAPDSPDLADILNNLGLVAWRRGELAQADQYFRRALRIEERHSVTTMEVANIFHNLAQVQGELGDWVAANKYDLKALQMRNKVAPGSLEVAASLNSLGECAEKQGNFREAEKYDKQALELERKLNSYGLDTALTLNQLGDVAQANGDLAGAESLYRQALKIREEISPGSINHAESLASLARNTRLRGQLDTAAPLYDRALQAFESQAARLGGVEEARSGFRARHAAYYADYIELLFRQKQSALAFDVAERARAQSFLEMLSAGRIDVRQGVDAGLLSQERRLQQAINTKSGDRIDLLNSKHTQGQVTELNQEMEKLLGQYQQVEDQIRVSSPTYADLTRPQPLNAKQVQEELLDPNTLLLEYSLGEQHSHVWVLSQTSLAAYDLPNRTTIEAAARRAYKLLVTQDPQGKTELNQKQARWDLAATRLSQMVLGPVAAQLHEKRLLIVADGALQYIPFEALPLISNPTAPGARRALLLVKHEIVYLPSASVLAMLREAEKAKKAPSKAVAVLADPVFDKEDVRIAAMRVPQRPAEPGPHNTEDDDALSSGHFTRSAGDLGLARFARLPFSRREADAILAVTPPGQGMEAVDFQASRATATDPALAEYRVVHFATHGLLDSKNPELSGLVLSMLDEAGNFQNGFLDLQDIYNLNLRADLVVLSACETALGKEIRGEGLIGLTRGFMYAGASRVLASLWKVDDVATAELMRRFYGAMEREGLRPAAALRRAQLEMWQQKRWNMPYYWAGFQLQGEWQ